MVTKYLPPIIDKLPLNLRSIYLKQGYQRNFFKTYLKEFDAIKESVTEVHQFGNFQDIPLIIVSHGKPNLFSGFQKNKGNSIENSWQHLQKDLTKLSNKSKLVIAENSGHPIQIDQPKLIIQLTHEMIAKLNK